MNRRWGKLDAKSKKDSEEKNKTEGAFWDSTLHDKIKIDQNKSHSIFAKSSFTNKEQRKSFNLTPQKDESEKREEARRLQIIEQRRQEEKAKEDRELDAKYSRWSDNSSSSYNYSSFGNTQMKTKPYKDSYTSNTTNDTWSSSAKEDDPTRGFFDPKPKKGFFF